MSGPTTAPARARCASARRSRCALQEERSGTPTRRPDRQTSIPVKSRWWRSWTWSWSSSGIRRRRAYVRTSWRSSRRKPRAHGSTWKPARCTRASAGAPSTPAPSPPRPMMPRRRTAMDPSCSAWRSTPRPSPNEQGRDLPWTRSSAPTRSRTSASPAGWGTPRRASPRGRPRTPSPRRRRRGSPGRRSPRAGPSRPPRSRASTAWTTPAGRRPPRRRTALSASGRRCCPRSTWGARSGDSTSFSTTAPSRWQAGPSSSS
mmetsp:Transcript_109888/g.311658  ORF Transcript_109888/g.311658 Transcript_109888/m.311658 type:complete len:260 (+) Transcript_109888:121-900(+)